MVSCFLLSLRGRELISRLEYALVLKALGPLHGDLYLLNRACKGAGTHEDILNEILLGRSNEEIFLLKEGYRRVYNKDLVQVVQGELSMKTER
jgi:annexin A7/11